ncbi:MAG TPA: F0F1 ATP synthase subunit epsilon [Chloroflexota bacterium]|nr:F0F1 ATP synthase subunit epsilon [Chloroflexota bacterium]
MPTHIEIVSAERRLLEDDVDEVIAPTDRGQIGILPRHAAMLTLLIPGELRLKKGGEEQIIAIGGGFLEVGDNRVTILADSAERAEEVDIARAEEARRRAMARLTSRSREVDVERAQLALSRSLARIKAVEHSRQRGGRAPRPTLTGSGYPPDLT